jgi:hypothetical protein
MQNSNNFKYDRTQEPLILSKPLIDLLLKQKGEKGKPGFGDLCTLYTFYYYIAKWQQTNQPKATTSYAAKGIGWSETKVRKVKKRLIELNLVQDVVTKDDQNKITGHYVHINFIWTKEKIDEIKKSHPEGFPQCGLSHTVENMGTNALNNNNINALNNNTEKRKDNNSNYYLTVPEGTVPKSDEKSFKKKQDTNLSPVKEQINEPRVDTVISFWNTLDKATKHKLNPDSNLYKEIKKYVLRLMEGLPLLHRKDKTIGQHLINFLSRHNIDENICFKKYSLKEIKQILQYIHDNYLRNDGRKYNLSNIFWNRFAPGGSFSYFYFVASQSQIPAEWVKLGDKLANIVEKNASEGIILDWAKSIQLFAKQYNYSWQEIGEVLGWYSSHVGKRYVPEIDGIEQFTEKYGRIKAAIGREIKYKQEAKKGKVKDDDPEFW